jgi:hypothetical protein
MYKFEMTIGWLATGTITVETNDFDVIEVLKEFIEYQEDNSWMGAWDATKDEESEGEEEVAEDEVEVVTE